MIAEVLSTGEEIRSGMVLDSNAAHIAKIIDDAGAFTIRHTVVGDNINQIVDTLREIGNRSQLCVVTGGLGPTNDDLTSEAAARAAGLELRKNDQALKDINRFFDKRNIPMSESNKKQAYLPVTSRYLENAKGTAPGFQMKIGKCVFFFLPGVPLEMKQMLSDYVLPYVQSEIEQKFGAEYRKSRRISTFGLPESQTYERIREVENIFPIVKLGLMARFPTIYVHLHARGDDEGKVEKSLDEAVSWVAEKLGIRTVSRDGESLEETVGRLLTKKNATVAISESCTGGLVAHLLTNVSGSSDYFLFSGVTYSNHAKVHVLGVSEQTLQANGAVHEETARQMAMGTRKVAGATYGLSTTGIAGPTGGSAEKPVGTVCIGIAAADEAWGRRLLYTFDDRDLNKTMFAHVALDLLRKKILADG